MADTVDMPRDGTCKITIGKDRYVLRQPTFGEMRKLRELFEDMREQINVAQAEQLANALDPKSHKNRLDHDEMVLSWVREAFGMLSDKELPLEDDLPPWIIDARFPGDLMKHWRTNPLHFGEK